MKLCVVQTQPVKADISANIKKHIELIAVGIAHGAETIIFPELSITGYEPKLAMELATHKDDERFAAFQEMSDKHAVTIGIGVPTRQEKGIYITMLLFQPGKPTRTYSKRFIHSDEEPYFISGKSSIELIGDKENIALAICYEISVPEHAENIYEKGAEYYMASVAKTARGVEKAHKTLAEIADKYAMITMMSNSVGQSDDFISAGQSAVWNRKGVKLGELNDSSEGVLIFDTDTEEVETIYIS